MVSSTIILAERRRHGAPRLDMHLVKLSRTGSQKVSPLLACPYVFFLSITRDLVLHTIMIISDTWMPTRKQHTSPVNTMIRLRSSDDFEVDVGAESICIRLRGYTLILDLQRRSSLSSLV
jgi:hypothetical protein